MSKVIVILGPTASGKTGLSIELAKVINGDIISADSMQIYKFMDVGTAKPDSEERAGIKHYLIDEVFPSEEFNVAKYQELALKYIDEISDNNKIPIVVGGTGLYINSLIYNINFSETICDWELRERLGKIAEIKGNTYLHDMLKEVDPEASEKIHENNLKRVIRALEVYEYTKKPISYHQEISLLVPSKHEFVIIGLKLDRERLYERINNRVDRMFEKGLIDEVKKLIEKGYHKNVVAMQGIGYKEILLYLRGEITIEMAKDIIKRESRRYAKRQITWFKRINNINWVEADNYSNTYDLIAEVLKIIK